MHLTNGMVASSDYAGCSSFQSSYCSGCASHNIAAIRCFVFSEVAGKHMVSGWNDTVTVQEDGPLKHAMIGPARCGSLTTVAALWAIANLAANRETSSSIAASSKRSSLVWWANPHCSPLTHVPNAAKRHSLVLPLFSRRLARYLSRRLSMLICGWKQAAGLKTQKQTNLEPKWLRTCPHQT